MVVIDTSLIRVLTAILGARDAGNQKVVGKSTIHLLMTMNAGQNIEIENMAVVLHPVRIALIAPTQIDLEIGKHRNLLDLLLDSLLVHLTIRMTLKIPGMAITIETRRLPRLDRILKQNSQAQGSLHFLPLLTEARTSPATRQINPTLRAPIIHLLRMAMGIGGISF